MKTLLMVNRTDFGKRICNLCKIPMNLLTLDASIFTCLQNAKCSSRSFTDEESET